MITPIMPISNEIINLPLEMSYLIKPFQACKAKAKRKFKATTNSNHDLPIAPNRLDRQFTVPQPNQIYVGDITYIYTLEGWLYLAVVIDFYSRQVMAEHMRAKLVNDVLLMAIWKRKPDKGSQICL